MQKKLIARTAKLLSESKKGRRFKGIAITYEHIPQDLDERNHGSLYAVININANSPEAEEMAELIIDTFHGEFYQNLHETPLASFEAALAKINEELAEATHQGRTGWLNNLNAIVAVLSGNIFHVSQSGKAEAYLYRGERSSHISEDLAGDSINPLRTFINIASGELTEGDKVAVVTPGVFFHISKDELKRYVKEFQPKVSISHIADLLEGTSNEVSPNAVLILEAITPEAASNETLDQQPDEIWISEPSKPVENAIDSAKPFLIKAAMAIGAGFQTARDFTAERVIPAAKDASSKTSEFYNSWQEKRKAGQTFGNVLTKTTESLSLGSSDVDLEETFDEGSSQIETATKPRKNEIYIKEHVNKPKWLILEKVDFSAAKKLGKKAQVFGKKYTKNKKSLAIIVAVALLLLSVSVFGIWRQKEAVESKKLAEATLSEAQSKYEIGKSSILAGNREQGSASLRDAKSIAEKLKNDKTYKTQASALISSITKSLDEAENVLRPSISEFASATDIVGTNTTGPIVINNNLFLINKDNGQIAAISLKNNEASSVLEKDEIKGKVLAATAVTARRVIAIITDQGNLYEFDTIENVLNKQEVSGEVEKPVAMAAFSTNIYSLTSDGKVYKRVKISGGYGRRTEYITDNSYLTDAYDLKIDSNIYVLNKSGEVYKYLAGKKQNFAINDLPTAMPGAKYMFTDEDTSGLFILTSSNRIVRVNQEGKFVSQFEFSSLSKIDGIFTNDSSKTAYLVSGGKVLKFSY